MGIEEKKALRTIMENFEQADIPALRTATGKASLTAVITADDTCTANELRVAAGNISNDFIKGLTLVCEDADYREELAKLNKCNIQIVKNVEKKQGDVYGALRCVGGELFVTVDGRHALGNGMTYAVRDAIKKLF